MPNLKTCPLCGSLLLDDYLDIVEELEDGSFYVDVFEAWVCENFCGYYERKL
ncbi:hypothetical protein EDD69_11352 [Thermolongibacillus altinsuensis]|jgi:hypothetical protein|uniref:Uncharacterized protein n=1 Tax=Thermolongibacillus altinsuensis TaxID=575256 RepID=A0A4V2QA15_9BACL|nr:hypothetical protein [Thermolongibacillus altinsuensis]TCL47046.1 hypothetical protein EDD69_11352 [Thermolongibacillus altinsuensis]GMB09529.1 hypothetical protein B1no1_22390 [Thermolongibacillus altinsuensis]